MNTVQKSQLVDFINKNQDALAALLFIADFNMPTERAKTSRKTEVALYVLRATGHETLSQQIKDRELNGYFMSLQQKFNECEGVINNKPKKSKKKLPTFEEAQNWIENNKEEVQKGHEWRKQYNHKIKSILNLFATLMLVSHQQFILAAQSAKKISQAHLAEMLAVAGDILVYGTPETHLTKPLWVTDEERILVHKLQQIWDITS